LPSIAGPDREHRCRPHRSRSDERACPWRHRSRRRAEPSRRWPSWLTRR